MATVLGCPGQYTVQLHQMRRVSEEPNPDWPQCRDDPEVEDCEPTIQVPLDRSQTVYAGTFDGVGRLSWQRVLRDVSEARIEIDLPRASASCCRLLLQTRSKISFIRIFRDGQSVWEGEVVQAVEEMGSPTKVIVARDWLQRLDEVTNTHRLWYEPAQPVAQIAEDVILRNILDGDFDDPVDSSLIADQVVVTGDVEQETQYRRGAVSDTVLNILKQLGASYGLDFFAYGRSIHLTRRATQRSATAARLTASHFQGRITVVDNGLEAATSAFATTQVEGDSEGDDRWPGITQAVLNVGTRWGRIDVLRRLQDSNADVDDVRRAAANALYGRLPPPTEIRMPSNARLSPQAPVTMEQLFPGARLDVYASEEDMCRPIRQAMRLTNLTVTWTPGGGEDVTATTSTLSDVTAV